MLSGFVTRIVSKLSLLGGRGRFPGKCHQQRIALFKIDDGHDQMVRPVDASHVKCMIEPHDLFGLVFRRFPDAFRIHMGADAGLCTQFWETFLTTEYGVHVHHHHPIIKNKTAAQLCHCIPLVLHGDAVPYSKKKSALLIQWGSLIGLLIARARTPSLLRCL